ncbi:MAG: hypothetical protein AAF383_28395 [Cyanobacteria bacterium P01_A01_bin.83]
MISPGLILAIALAFIHGFASKLTFVCRIPRFRWTSFAGGVSLSYVFLKIFPDLSYQQVELQYTRILWMPYRENHVYLLALSGLLVFYRLDIWAYKVKSAQESLSPAKNSNATSFWIHLGAFAILNVITGYLLQDLGDYGLKASILFFIPIAFYFFIIDEKLRIHQQSLYDRQGRWCLVSAIFCGTAIGQVAHLSEVAIAIVWSFLAGSIILNVLKRELPDEHESCFGSFVTGTILFTVLMLLT